MSLSSGIGPKMGNDLFWERGIRGEIVEAGNDAGGISDVDGASGIIGVEGAKGISGAVDNPNPFRIPPGVDMTAEE